MTIEKKINKIEDLNNILINWTSIQNNKNLKQTYLKNKMSNLGSNEISNMKCGWNWWKISYL